MPTPTKGARLGGSPAHQRLILANMATQLFAHDRITTTEAKAKRLRPYAERLVSFAKRGDLASRRRVMRSIGDKGVVHRLFTEIAPDMAERPGGYTRITKIAPRKGDNAPMVVIELVREAYSAKQSTVKEAEAATQRAAKDEQAAAPAETVTEASAPAALLDGGFGDESAAPLDGGASPDESKFTVKGNKDSMKYHVPGSRWFDSTVAEVWFTTSEAAVAAGFEPAGGEAAQKVDEA